MPQNAANQYSPSNVCTPSTPNVGVLAEVGVDLSQLQPEPPDPEPAPFRDVLPSVENARTHTLGNLCLLSDIVIIYYYYCIYIILLLCILLFLIS